MVAGPISTDLPSWVFATWLLGLLWMSAGCSAASASLAADSRDSSAGERGSSVRPSSSTAPGGADQPLVQRQREATPGDAHTPSPAAKTRIQELAVPGFEPALVVLPAGSGPFPVLFAAHGAGGRAEFQCAYWLSLLERPMVIVCPKGKKMSRADPGSGYYYPSHLELEREVLAIASELSKLAGVAPPPWGYAGYSQGATMGALMLVDHGDRFDRALLIEGGTEGWTSTRAQRFARKGAQRVLLVCGTSSCARDAEVSRSTLENAGLEVRHVAAVGAGHTYGGAVQELVARELVWLFAPEQPAK